MDAFSDIASKYSSISVDQSIAANRLLAFYSFKGNERVLDLGCGPGHITAKLASLTNNDVIGLDSSEEMIRIARQTITKENIKFNQGYAEELTANEMYDVIFCNSAFHWFKNPLETTKKIFNTIKVGGCFLMQAPSDTPDLFKNIIRHSHDEELTKCLKYFSWPVSFLEEKNSYQSLLKNSGFKVIHCDIENQRSEYSTDELIQVFNSGQGRAYFNKNNYSISVPRDIKQRIEKIILSIAKENNTNDKVTLISPRVFAVCIKEKPNK